MIQTSRAPWLLLAAALCGGLVAGWVPQARAAVCGDGSCEVSEDAVSCPADCHYACGDGICGYGEDGTNCAVDCPHASCGSGFCEAPETAASCLPDCHYACGDGLCGCNEDFGNCEVDCPDPTCGNGECEAWEDELGCPADCADNCGDGFCSWDAGQGFEDHSTCSEDCPSETCGDGFCTNGEEHTTCAVDCPNPSCGDLVCAGEPDESCYSCEIDCGVCAPLCGDGVVQVGEECDDQNLVSGDGCSDVCVIEFCSDGLVQPGIGEACDDGNIANGDGCSAACRAESCGDLLIQPGLGEACDANALPCTTAAGYPGTTACQGDCSGFAALCETRLTCGDGICTFPPESADPSDPGFCPGDCAPAPAECIAFLGQTLCQSACGDGVISGSELCDDGNTDSLDGCSAECEPDSVPALPTVALGSVNGGDWNGDGRLDGADLQDALDTACGTGCVLELPAAEYTDVAVTIPTMVVDGLVVRGQGMDATRLLAPVPQVDHMVSLLHTNAFTVFQKLGLDGQKQIQTGANPSPSGIVVQGSGGGGAGPGRVEQVRLANFIAIGVSLQNAKDWVVNHSTIHDLGCGDGHPCDLIGLPYQNQVQRPQLKSVGFGVNFLQGTDGALAHHNTVWNATKIALQVVFSDLPYRLENNFVFSSRGGVIGNNTGGLHGLVSHNYIERVLGHAISTRTGDVAIHGNVLVDNYGIAIQAESSDHDLTVSNNYVEHDCRYWGDRAVRVRSLGGSGHGAVVRDNEFHLGGSCTEPVEVRRSDTLFERNFFYGGNTGQLMKLRDACDITIRESTFTGAPSSYALNVSKNLENLYATFAVDVVDYAAPALIHSTVDPELHNINILVNFDIEEAVDGDLSGDPLAPTPLALDPGSNLLRASQQGPAHGQDVDYLTITVPTGFRLSALVLEEFAGNGSAFVGIQAGSQFDTEAALLGGVAYDDAQVGGDLLAAMVGQPVTTSLVPPLFAGDYTIWLNQMGAPSTAAFDLVLEALPAGPEIEVLGGAVLVADGDTTPSAAEGTEFPEAMPGGPIAWQDFTIRNAGTATLDVASIALSGPHAGDFTMSGFVPGALAAEGGTTSFQVGFAPSAEGVRSATVEITNDDANEGLYDFAVQGTGAPPGVPGLLPPFGVLLLAAALLAVGARASGRGTGY